MRFVIQRVTEASVTLMVRYQERLEKGILF